MSYGRCGDFSASRSPSRPSCSLRNGERPSARLASPAWWNEQGSTLALVLRYTRICCATPADTRWRTKAMIPAPCRLTSGIAISNTLFATPSYHRRGSRISGGMTSADGRHRARPRDRKSRRLREGEACVRSEFVYLSSPMGSGRTRIRVCSRTTTLPFASSVSSAVKFASNRESCRSGLLSALRLKRITDGLRCCLVQAWRQNRYRRRLECGSRLRPAQKSFRLSLPVIRNHERVWHHGHFAASLLPPSATVHYQLRTSRNS